MFIKFQTNCLLNNLHFLSQHDSVGLQCFELSVGGCVCVCVSSFSKNVYWHIFFISQPIEVRLEKMAERARSDPEYQQMIKYLEEGTPAEEMDRSSEMYLMEGERQFLGTYKCG